MNNLFKRSVAMLLFAVMVFGFLPNFPETAEAVSTPATKSTETISPTIAVENILTAEEHNFDFEGGVQTGTNKPVGWNILSDKNWADYELVSREGGGSALQFTTVDKGQTSGGYGIYSEPINVEAYQGKNMMLTLDTKGDQDKAPLMVYVYYYMNTDKPTGMGSVGVNGFGSMNCQTLTNTSWKTISKFQLFAGDIVVPEGAVYARIILYRIHSHRGTILIDNITLRPVCDNHTFTKGYASFVPYDSNVCQQSYFKRCDNCDYFRCLEKVSIAEGTVTGAATHDIKLVPEVAPSEGNPGNIAHYSCSKCGLKYFDAEGKNQVVDEDALVPGLRYRNLLAKSNPSFEDGIQGADDPVKWTTSDSSEKFYAVTDEFATDGTHSLMLTTVGATSPRGLYTEYFAVSGIEKLSVHYMLSGDSDMQVYMYFYNADKVRISNVAGERTTVPGSPTYTWTLCYGAFTVPEGAVYGRLLVYKSHSSQLGTNYIDDIVVKEYQKSDEPEVPRALDDSFENGIAKNGLPWGWAYYYADTNNREVISLLDTKGELSAGDPKKAADGDHYFKFTQNGEGKKMYGIASPYIDVTGMKALMLMMNMHGDSMTQVYVLFYDQNYKCPEGSDWRPWSYEQYETEWDQVANEITVPEGAYYARVMITKPYTEIFHGTVYFDRVRLEETEPTLTQVVYPPVPEEKHYDWSVAYSDHPRVYFNDKDLRVLKKWIKNESLTSFGYSGKEVYQNLIATADQYLTETNMHLTYTNFTMDLPLYPKLADISLYPELELAPAPGYAVPYPYMTRINWDLMDRVQILCLAYVLSGEQKYADRAMQYALDMCDWKAWEDSYLQHQAKDPNGETTAQPLTYAVTAIATVYDTCFDLLTDAEKEKMETNLIERGLKPLYRDAELRMARGRDMDHMSTTYIICAALLNEDNCDVLGKYLDRATQYTEWIFNFYDMGHNEGYDYAANGIDQQAEGLAAIERVTGFSGMLEHHFFTETLPAWTKGFVESGKGTFVGYSDSPYIREFMISLGVLAKRGDGDQAAGYAMYLGGGAENPWDALLYTHLSDDYIMIPDDDYMNVTVVDIMGVGSLRTGWEKLDKLMVMISDDYGVGHAHWECNAIFMAMNGTWLIKDPGYGSIQAGVPKTEYDMKYSSNTIIVDGKAQSVKGVGTIKEVVNSELYGHITGSAPNAYGKQDNKPVLTKFDRHTIMLNHDSESYYVVIDDLASNNKHEYGFNMYQASWDRLEIDGEYFEIEKTYMGNHLALLKDKMVLHTQFVGNPLTITAPYFRKAGQEFGPLLRATSNKTKEHQFMTVISVDPSYEGINTIDATGTLTARNSNLSHTDENGWSWSSSNDHGMVIALPMPEHGLNMFRAGAVGDWMSFKFDVEEEGDFIFAVTLGKWPEYGGSWQVYLDGKPIGEPYSAQGNASAGQNITMTWDDSDEKTVHFTAGQHEIKVELVGDVNTEDPEWGTLISMGVVVLEEQGSFLGDGPVKVLESYDTDDVLGATIAYGTVLNDIVLSNKGTGVISGGKLTTDAKQATVMGLYEDEIMEGFSVTDATTAKYGDLTLLTSDGPITMAVDYRFSKVQVLNIEVDEDYIPEEDEDFDIKKPTTTITASATEARTISVQVGTDTPYAVSVDGAAVEATYADGMITMTIPEGDHVVTIVGTHHCEFDQHATKIGNVKTWATCTEPTVYYVSCHCGENGTETFVAGEPKGHNIVAVKAKDATAEKEGCIAHFACKNCDKVYSDKAGTNELKLSDVTIPRIGSGAGNAWIIWVAVGGGVLVLAAAALLILKFKFGFFAKKENNDENENEEQTEE